MYPETKHGGAPGEAGGGKAKGDKLASFAADTAAKTGKPERSIQRDATRAKALGPILTASPERRGTRSPNWARWYAAAHSSACS